MKAISIITLKQVQKFHLTEIFSPQVFFVLTIYGSIAAQGNFEEFFPCTIIIPAIFDIWITVPLATRRYH